MTAERVDLPPRPAEPLDGSGLAQRFPVWALRTGSVFVAAFVVIAFIVTVMTAVAQQDVLERMQKENLQLGYSSAYGLVKQIEDQQSDLGLFINAERLLKYRLPRQRADLSEAQNRLESDWADFAPLAKSIAKSGTCDLPPTNASSPEDRLGVWNDSIECQNNNALPPKLDQRLRAFAAGPQNIGTDAQKLGSAAELFARTTELLPLLQQRIQEETTLSDDQQKAQRSFSEMAVLREHLLLGRGVLAEFPPALLQIVLAFISGAFGALLVTVILIVYPKNDLKLDATSRPGARILLGGMIAMCVLIVLLGGTAVLGTSMGTATAGMNYMGFSAIAILAGMFSDRVAFWLSARANSFFQPSRDSGAARARPEDQDPNAGPAAPQTAGSGRPADAGVQP